MADAPIAIDGIDDPSTVRVVLYASGQDVHAPLNAIAAAAIHGAPIKATPIDADEFGYWDSVDLQAVNATWANLKATLKTYFDTLYAAAFDWAATTHAAASKTPPVDADEFSIVDSAASNVIKKLTWANLKATMIAALGTAATQNTGTSGANIPFLNGVNTWSGVQTFSANPSLTGGAVSFPATQVPSAGANDLDDYEEGTFTPTIVGTSAAGTGTYSTQSGKYTKIGNVVHFRVKIVTTAHTGTGDMEVSGLPFTSANDGIETSVSYIPELISIANTPGVARMRPNSTAIALGSVKTDGTGSFIAQPIDADNTVNLAGFYFV